MDKFNAEIKQNIRGKYNIYIDYYGRKLVMSETRNDKPTILEFNSIENAVAYLEDKKRIILNK